MNSLKDHLSRIKPVNKEVLPAVQKRLDSQTKPLGSLGRLEELCKIMALVQGTERPTYEKRTIFTIAGDHGVVEEGVSAYPQSVTGQMVLNFVNGGAGVNVLARHSKASVIVVDMGVAQDIPSRGFLNKKIDYGTKNFTRGPAMTHKQAELSVCTGIELALERDFDILGTGDMGIGNTTPSSAIASVITGIPPAKITGRGTGVDNTGLTRKIRAIERGIEINKPDPSDAIDVLSKVGGYEIGGIAGLIIGAAIKRRLAVVDGFISTAGALIAQALHPAVSDYFILSHLSAEKGHTEIVEYMDKRPLLDLGLRLGEGTGAALAIELIDAAMHLYYEMATFDQAGVDKKLD